MEESTNKANDTQISHITVDCEHSFTAPAPTDPSSDPTAEKFSYHQELSKVEDLSRVLKDTQHRLNSASMRSHLLNVDIVTQFNPYQADELHKIVMDCENCIKRMKEREAKMIQLLAKTSN